ncbi:pre-RNA processing PIH1/Nop17 protein [Toxoplasma gondii VAND]|uniref:Pre-RNA processing PIH1/Nop17 protein n=1 Tax=Toxoplasma gondii VAND TaxID=933077 RepID=A0A086QFW4_TOXGO|nr:pre-RNA processing PIH1/Nop17 protein [Toxoplasma gondii VAND]
MEFSSNQSVDGLIQLQEWLAQQQGGESQNTAGIDLPTKDGGVLIFPEPHSVLKGRQESGEKVFVNICTHSQIEPWHYERLLADDVDDGASGQDTEGVRIPLSVGERIECADKEGQPCISFDVVFNPGTVHQCLKEPKLKQLFAQFSLAAVAHKYGLKLRDEFSFPKLRYKGHAPQPQRVKVTVKSKIQEVETVSATEPTSPGNWIDCPPNGNIQSGGLKATRSCSCLKKKPDIPAFEAWFVGPTLLVQFIECLLQKRTFGPEAQHLGSLSDARFSAWKCKYAGVEDDGFPECSINAFDFDRVTTESDGRSGGSHEDKNAESSKEPGKEKGATFQFKKAFLLSPDEQERHDVENKTVTVTRSSLRGSAFLLQLDLRRVTQENASLCCGCDPQTTSSSRNSWFATSARQDDNDTDSEMPYSTGSSSHKLGNSHGDRPIPLVTVSDIHLLVTWTPDNEASDSVGRQKSRPCGKKVDSSNGATANTFEETASARKPERRVFLFPFPFSFCSLFSRALVSTDPYPLLTVIVPTDEKAAAGLECCFPSIYISQGPHNSSAAHTGTVVTNVVTTSPDRSCANFDFEKKRRHTAFETSDPRADSDCAEILPGARDGHTYPGWEEDRLKWTESEIADAFLDTVF